MAKLYLTDETIQRAAEKFNDARLSALPAPEACEHEYPPGFYESLLLYLKRKKRRRDMLRRTIAAMLALLLCGGIVLTANTNARAAFFSWMRNGLRGQPLAFSDLRPTDELIVYLPDGWGAYNERHRLDIYKLISGIDVKVVTVEGDYTGRVLQDMEEGNGPDILLLDYMNLDTDKAVLNGMFLDLTDILAGDEDFSEDGFLPGVFEPGRWNGRQYTMPVSLSYSYLMCLPERLDELGFRRSRMEKLSDFLEELARVTPKAAQDPRFEQMMYSPNYTPEFFAASGIRLLDYHTGTVLPDEQALSDFLHACKAYFPYDYDEKGNTWWSNGGYLSLSDRHCNFWNISSITDMTYGIYSLRAKGIESEILPTPSQTGEKFGHLRGQIAVSAEAKNKLNAYNYIRFLLSPTIQADENVLPGFMPIRKESIRGLLHLFQHVSVLPDGETSAFSEEELDAMYETLTSAARYDWGTPAAASGILWESMLPFLKNEKSYRSCLADLRTRLTDYMNE